MKINKYKRLIISNYLQILPLVRLPLNGPAMLVATTDNKRKGASIIVLVFSLLAILGFASLVIDLGMTLNQRYELQKAVESAALIGASEYELYEVQETAGDTRLKLPSDSNITTLTGINYKKLRDTNQFLQFGTDAHADIDFKDYSRAIKVTATATSSTYIIAIFGIRKIKINAAAAAVAVPVYLSNGSIINGDGTYKDTEIRDPLGSDTSSGTVPTGTVLNLNNNFDNIYGPPDSKSLSLGPGGYITIRLPATIYDGKGADFIIYERGNAEGYFVYAGIDANPAKPYVDAAHPGGGIKWINVSCTGIPLYVKMDKEEVIGSYRTTVTIRGTFSIAYKFYGSGLFDLGDKCTVDNTTIYDGTTLSGTIPRIKNVKYLKIIDDDKEDGFFLQPRLSFTNQMNPAPYTEHGIPMIIPGEHSTFTPGADIDAIAILHHSRLISIADYNKDFDDDKLIDVKEDMIGTLAGNINTDNNGLDDMIEYEGYNPDYAATSATDVTVTPQYWSAPTHGDIETLFKGYPTKAFAPPVMEISP